MLDSREPSLRALTRAV